MTLTSFSYFLFCEGRFLGFILQPLFERYINFGNHFLSFIRSLSSVIGLFFTWCLVLAAWIQCLVSEGTD